MATLTAGRSAARPGPDPFSRLGNALWRLFTSVDFPRKGSVVAPQGAPGVDLATVWSFGLRMVFDWRYYW